MSKRHAIPGLPDKESLIYRALAEQGNLSLSALARATSIQKTTLYLHINTLLARGLILRQPVGKRIHYRAANPQKLLTAIDQQRDALAKQMPTLLAAYASAADEPSVAIFEGKDGILRLFDDIAREANYLKTWWSPERYFRLFSRQRDERTFVQPLIDRGIDLKTLIEYGKESEAYIRSARAGNYRQLPKSYGLPVNALMWNGSHTALVSYENLYALSIENRAICAFHESMFDNLWLQLK